MSDEHAAPAGGPPYADGSPKIALGAIAKNEGAYLADWIHHHLYFGFERINIWVNGTSDQSESIVNRISAQYPAVICENVDQLMQRSLSGGGMFQHLAYEGLGAWAAESGASHLAFFDLDEYWTPTSFTDPVSTWIHHHAEADVLSFPWYLDTPDAERMPFGDVFHASQSVIPNHHVKSIARLSPNIKKFGTHTAELHQGKRVLVDQEFIIHDAVTQVHGSKISSDQFKAFQSALPDAFIYHRMFRSQLEYVSILGKGLAQAGSRLPLKKNREGYRAPSAARLRFDIDAGALQAYLTSREGFYTRTGITNLVTDAERHAMKRGHDVLTMLDDGNFDKELAARVMPGIDREMVAHHIV